MAWAAAMVSVGEGYAAAESTAETIGVALAISSTVFIGASFIIKKKGLRVAARQGTSAGAGGFGYLREPLWWIGLIMMIVGELANFAAYAFAPPILVTPMGALSIVVSAILAHLCLDEKLNTFGIVGCMLCIVGSTTIVLHAPPERPIGSIGEMFALAEQPGFLIYTLVALSVTLLLILGVAPKYGKTHIFVNIGICSLMGSLSVMSCKALGLALRLTFAGDNQLLYPSTYLCILIVAICIVTQMNYLNKALDLFNTAIVSPIYYVMFTTLTILASFILLQPPQYFKAYLSQACGFLAIVGGTFILHTTKDMEIAGLGMQAGSGPLIRVRSPEGPLLPQQQEA